MTTTKSVHCDLCIWLFFSPVIWCMNINSLKQCFPNLTEHESHQRRLVKNTYTQTIPQKIQIQATCSGIRILFITQVANTRPTGRIWPFTLFYLSWHLVSTWWQCQVPCPQLEQLHLNSPKITFSPLKVTARLMWPPVKMSLTPLVYKKQSG